MGAARAATFDAVLHRMHERRGLESLPAHLEKAHGITVTAVRTLDVGVLRVDGAGTAPVVVRVFSAARPYRAAEGDLAVLRYLAEAGFPAERPFGAIPLSTHEGQAVLVTGFIRQAPKAARPARPIVALGRMVGRLHQMAPPPGADRPAGALHHYAEGTMADELRAVSGWLEELRAAVQADRRPAVEAIRRAVAGADGGDGLPEGFVHPDPVPKNVVFTADGPVLIDWTSAGRGPRLASMTLVLRSGWAAAPFMKGYVRELPLNEEERSRLVGLLFSRSLIELAFRVCRDPEAAVPAAKKLAPLRADSDAKARELLAL